MRISKIFILFLFIFNFAYQASSEELGKQAEIKSGFLNTGFDDNTTGQGQLFAFAVNRQVIENNLEEYKIANIGNYADLYRYIAKKNNSKITLTNMQIAAIVMLSIGIVSLLAGAGLLAGSLAYSDYLDKNENDYGRYVAGKNMSRVLFYGAMGAFGAGLICIAISIPLFIDYKKTSKKK